MNVADKMCTSLEVSEEDRELTRLVVLLHDVGHGPFSHLFEEGLKSINGNDFSHEYVSSWLFKDDPVIASVLGDKVEAAQKLMPVYEGVPDSPLLREIVSSGLDADKLDYLRRDSYHIGVAYGSFDFDRIMHTLSCTPDQNNICALEKGKDALENYRLGRYLMHVQVYAHHTRLITDQMFLRALKLAIADGTIDQQAFKIGSARNEFQKADHSQFLKNYVELTDDGMMRLLANGKGNSKKLTQGLQLRNLLKTAVEVDLTLEGIDAGRKKAISEMENDDLKQLESEVAKMLDIDPELIIAYLQEMTIKLYDPYDLLVKRSNGSVATLESMSPISASSNSLIQLYVFCEKQSRDSVRKATCKYLGIAESVLPP